MRDINRIPGFMNDVGDCWRHVPDWRFGQLMCNFFGWMVSEKGRDPFFPEEEEMASLLSEYIKTFGGSNE